MGIAPSKIGEVIGITKAYCTRVGSGPFPTELFDEMGEFLRKEGAEFGATTGRPRRTGWLDLPQLKYTIMLNGVDHLCVTKMDVLNTFETIEVATSYKVNGELTDQLPYELNASDLEPQFRAINGWAEDINHITNYDELPDRTKDYVSFIESYLNVPVTMISTGPERESLIIRS